MQAPDDPATTTNTNDSTTSGAREHDDYDSDDPPPLTLDVAELKRRASAAFSVRCTDVETLTRGSFHEICALHFDRPLHGLGDGQSSCIVRFSRTEECVERARGALDTMRYVREHTDLPVPRVYLADLDPGNAVGAQFMLMQRMPGRHLFKFWHTLDTDSKKHVIGQIARALAQLASLKFDRIGWLGGDGQVGPIHGDCGGGDDDDDDDAQHDVRGPFASTAEYLTSFVSEKGVRSAELRRCYRDIRHELQRYLDAHEDERYLRAPYRLIHADFNGQNLLFRYDGGIVNGQYSTSLSASSCAPPQLTGIVDFENSYVGPLYFLYEYPVFVQDVDWSREQYAENKVLRRYFVRALRAQFAHRSAAHDDARACMRNKDYPLNDFWRLFVPVSEPEESMVSLAQEYLRNLRDGTGRAYSGRSDYTPDTDSEEDDDDAGTRDVGRARGAQSESVRIPARILSLRNRQWVLPNSI
ncbi:MAG: hypothetical protein M1815_006223 [Lichina confinis]|nr:MAG: hypothetical protein M1815_006223 [Lichina confinis]